MRFAENNRISHRQLFRQIILVFLAPFLLCLFKNGESYSDLSGSYKVTNAGAVGTIDLDCGMGSIDFDIES